MNLFQFQLGQYGNIIGLIQSWATVQTALILLLFATTALASYGCFYLYRKHRAYLKKHLEQQKTRFEEYLFQKRLLEESPYSWIMWNLKENTLYFPEKSAPLVEGHSGEMTLTDFLDKLEEKAAVYLWDRLEDLLNKDQLFQASISFKAGQKVLNIIGIPKQEETATYMTLWVREIKSGEDGSGILSYTAFKRLLDTLPFPIWHRDKDQNLTYCNRMYAEIMDQTVADVLKSQETPWSDELVLKNTAAGMIGKKKEHIILKGDRKLVEFREYALPYTSGRIGYSLDLSEAEKSQKRLDRHINAHQEMLERLSSGIAIYSSDQRLTFFNHAYARMFDMDENWLHSRPTLMEVLDNLHRRKLIQEQSNFPAFKKRQSGLFTSLITPLQELLHLPDERTIRLVTSPYPMGGLFFLFEDVTDSLVLERQANTQLAVMKETIDNLYEGVMVFANNHTLKLFNPAFTKMWNMPRSELTPGMHINEVFEKLKNYFDYGEDWGPYQETILSNLNERIAKSGRLNRKDNSVLEFSYVPLPDGSHLLSYFDVSDGYRVERALREKNEALKASDQLKTDFLDHVSYELKTPLNTIIGFSEILMSKYFGDMNKPQSAYCKGILNAAQQQLAIVNDMVDLATIEAGHMILNLHAVDVKKLLDSIVSMVQKRAEDYKLNLTYTCSKNLKDIVADERRLKQAIFNILNNAIKLTPSGGEIKMTAKKVDNVLEIMVKDTGPGMTGDEQQNVFKIFERTERGIERYQGSGVGLPLVKSLIELHGGRVLIDSTLGEGTTITCQIPLSLSAAPQQDLLKIS